MYVFKVAGRSVHGCVGVAAAALVGTLRIGGREMIAVYVDGRTRRGE